MREPVPTTRAGSALLLTLLLTSPLICIGCGEPENVALGGDAGGEEAGVSLGGAFDATRDAGSSVDGGVARPDGGSRVDGGSRLVADASTSVSPLDGGASADASQVPTDPAARRCPGGCDDGIECTEDRCVSGVCSHVLALDRCGAGLACDLSAGGCVATGACGADADCADDDPCTRSERCDPARAACQWDVLDGDGDSHAPLSCGGDDADDSDPGVHPGAVDVCDGVDNDADGMIDEEPDASSTCSGGTTCANGTCPRCLGVQDMESLTSGVNYAAVAVSCVGTVPAEMLACVQRSTVLEYTEPCLGCIAEAMTCTGSCPQPHCGGRCVDDCWVAASECAGIEIASVCGHGYPSPFDL